MISRLFPCYNLALLLVAACTMTSTATLRGVPRTNQRSLNDIPFGQSDQCMEYRLDHALLPEIFGDWNREVDVSVQHRGANSYWGTYFNSEFYVDDQQFAGWCGNLDLELSSGHYKVDVWSAYSHDQEGFQEAAIDDQTKLFRVNWLFNNFKAENQQIEFEQFGDLDSCAGPITWKEYQLAVWLLIDDGPYDHDSIDGVEECVGEHLAARANEITYYEPDCLNLLEERLAVVLIFDNNNGRVKKQTVIVDYMLADTEICVCDDDGLDEIGGVNGDPHFKTWTGAKYDFHGACDLVLLQDPKFQDGLGLDIHIRTKHTKQWSFISAAVLQIGEDTLEVRGGMDGDIHYWFNKESGGDLSEGLSGFPVEYVKNNEKQSTFVIKLGEAGSDGRAPQITIKTFKEMVRVDVDAGVHHFGTNGNFASSVGLMGSYDREGLWMTRDGETVLHDAVDFGMEWQVREDEPMLFHNVEGPQAPESCAMPVQATMRRRLDEVTVSLEDAELACSRVSEAEFDNCVFDVMAMNDKEIAGAY